MKSPISWIGGKGLFVNNLLERVPEHETYVEVFGGAAALLFAKRQKGVEIYNDVNSGLVGLFRVLQSEEKFDRFHRRVSAIPFSREIFVEYKQTWHEQEDEIERALQWFVVARQCFASVFKGGWGPSVKRDQATSWMNVVEGLPNIHHRLMHVTVEHNDWRKILEYYDSQQTFFYLDPPYVHSSERGEMRYEHELSNDDHRDLVKVIQDLKGSVMLSGYRNEIYDALPWDREDFETYLWSASPTKAHGLQGEGGYSDKKRTECLWRNYETQMTLF